MEEAQRAQQRACNRPAQPREFQLGDRVLVLVPTTTCKFLATWQGPYTVREKVGPINYRLDQPGRRKPRVPEAHCVAIEEEATGTTGLPAAGGRLTNPAMG
ncbi:hypothetical protein SRHO_G00005640 [Serrasalmus rhombeus]